MGQHFIRLEELLFSVKINKEYHLELNTDFFVLSRGLANFISLDFAKTMYLICEFISSHCGRYLEARFQNFLLQHTDAGTPLESEDEYFWTVFPKEVIRLWGWIQPTFPPNHT